MHGGFWSGNPAATSISSDSTGEISGLSALLCMIPFLIFFFFFLHPLNSQSMSAEELLGKTGAALHWDPWRLSGQLVKGDTILTFRLDEPWMVLNGKHLIVSGTVIEESGKLIFSSRSASKILEIYGFGEKVSSKYLLDTILIDPGHGGRDSGARKKWNIDGTVYPLLEKDIVLDVGLRLDRMLEEKYPEKRILLTRDKDVYPTLEERVEMANGIRLKDREAMVYISLHANASLNSKAEGFEVWYLPEDYRRELITQESGEATSSIAPIVNTLWEEEFTDESVRLADMILSGISKNLGTAIPNRGRREESWFVVRNTRMASVLVEVGFVTHQAEATRLRNPDYLNRIAQGIYDGIVSFVNYFEGRGL